MYGHRPPQGQYPQPQYGQGYPPQGPPQQYPQQPPQQYPSQPSAYPRGPMGPPAGMNMPPQPPHMQQAPPHMQQPSPVQPRAATAFSRSAIPPAVSAYESQAAKWKQGFKTGGATGNGGSTRTADLEAPFVAELCSSAGSSYPARDVLQKFLRHLPSLDHQYLCELLDDKLEGRLWQVQAKALSVLDALFKSAHCEFFKTHYYHKGYLLEALCRSKKELLKARAEKVFNVIKAFAPPAPPSPEAEPSAQYASHPSQYAPQQQQEAPSLLLPPSPIVSPAPPQPELPDLMGGFDAPTTAPPPPAEAPVSAFGFLNAALSSSAPSPVSQAPVSAAPEVSAFSFLSAATALSVPAAVTPSAAPVSVAPTPVVDVFSSLPAPTPISGLAIQQEPDPVAVPEEPKVSDPIHDAFEGLSFGDEDEPAEEMASSNENPLEGFSTSSQGTMGNLTTSEPPALPPAPVAVSETADPIREVFFEIDVPFGPMGLMLDRSIPHMAVVAGFIPLPTGERGYLEMHPVLSPGCALVSVNGINVEDKPLEEVGALLGSLIGAYKLMRFKKLTRFGRIVNPASTDITYAPPPPEKPEGSDKSSGDDSESEADDEYTSKLNGFKAQLDAVESKLDKLVTRDRAHEPIIDLKNELAQLHGNVEKIQTQGIDAVILGANPPPNADEIRQLRSSLVRRADALTKRIQKIATHGTAPSPLITGAAGATVGSPVVSAFSFVGGGASVPPLQLSETPAAQTSAFSFMQSAPSPPTSPLGGGVSGFGFLQNSSAPAPAAPTTVFAGLSLKQNEVTEPPSAFGFLSGRSNSSAEPQRVTSPTAFSFLRGGPGSPAAVAAPPASGGSAFSFIS